MNPSFRQLKAVADPRPQYTLGVGQAIAKLRFGAAEASRRWDIEFERTSDDLDFIDVVVIAPDKGNVFVLAERPNNPIQGLEIWTHWESSDLARDFQVARETLGLSTDDVIWLHDRIL